MTILSKIRSHSRPFAKDDKGLAVVEFALILPIFALLIVATWEATNAIAVKRKASLSAAIIADLATQGNSFSAEDWNRVSDIFDKAMFPYTQYTKRANLIGLRVDARERVTVVCSFGTQMLDENSLPEGLIIANSFYMMAATEVDYTVLYSGRSLYGDARGFTDMTFRDNAIFTPRISSAINCS
ncbi:TadE-like protein [Cohaesibacter sp. ES.047]|uniref:TadE/TadG family type IV pilus assembly protein n=1 Tax=Cohaesibacter sp. ES.047 TaxID=1798205 RepID=UPI000BB89B6A|nr:TadE/TadG family type IV pilus assembly protein [Cohaesibacter sp. ES.047]SNY91817.1 TadE-like protein [Cohaesibacter sp. ES.047]